MNYILKLRPLINNSKIPKEQVLNYIKVNISVNDYEKVINSYLALKSIKLKNLKFSNAENILHEYW